MPWEKVALRNFVVTSNAPQCVDISFTTWHDLAMNKVRYGKEERFNRYVCAMCKIDPLEEPISRDNRTLHYSIQCSVVAESLKNIKKGRIYVQSTLAGITDTCRTKWSGHLR